MEASMLICHLEQKKRCDEFLSPKKQTREGKTQRHQHVDKMLSSSCSAQASSPDLNCFHKSVAASCFTTMRKLEHVNIYPENSELITINCFIDYWNSSRR